MDNLGLTEWSQNGNPRLKKFADEHKGKKIQDIWMDYQDPAYPEYPTQKNLSMLEMIIKQSSEKNSIVLDAFAGSGNTLLAAKMNDRKFIAIDQSPVAINIMKQKFLQPDLFFKTEYIDLTTKKVKDSN
ncbi:MAG: DNA methyltransferase [Christensenellaceae bacterium]